MVNSCKVIMSRRARAAAKNEPTAAKQIEGHAFNVFGWAMEIPSELSAAVNGVIIINAYEPSTTPWEKAVVAMEKRGEAPWRESLNLTPRELDSVEEAGVGRYLLVGFTCPRLKDEHFKKHSSQTKQKPVGTYLAADGIIRCDGLPVMIVTQTQDTEQSKIDLFALLRPRLGLCTPFHIGQKGCFYLPMFRDETTDLKLRGPAWNKLVAKQSLRPSDGVLSSKQLTFKRARNTTKVILEPKVSLQNEICSLIECFGKTGEMWHLKELVSVLEDADDDLIFSPPASNTAMRKFIDNDDEFEGEYPALMVKELGQLWPDLKGIDATDLLILKEQLVRQHLVVEYRLIRPFLSEACFQIQELRANTEGLLDVAEKALATVRRVLQYETAVPILTPDNESLLIPTIISGLKNILHAGRTFDKGLKDNSGDQTMTGTLHDVWEKYSNALDTDAAKLAWFQAVRYLSVAQKHKQRGLDNMISDMVEVLEEMKLPSKLA
jgi:hypothetical protein